MEPLLTDREQLIQWAAALEAIADVSASHGAEMADVVQVTRLLQRELALPYMPQPFVVLKTSQDGFGDIATQLRKVAAKLREQALEPVS